MGIINNSSWGTGNVASNGGLPGISHSLDQLAQAQTMTVIGLKGKTRGLEVSKESRNFFADPTFTDCVSISTGTNISGPTGASSASADQSSSATTPLTLLVTPPSRSTSLNRMSASSNTMADLIPVSLSPSPSLSLLLPDFLPEFLIVYSLQGAFLYVTPSIWL
jgi:hypothetical protein